MQIDSLQDPGDFLPGRVESRRLEVVRLGHRAEIHVDAPRRFLQNAEELPVETDLDGRDVLSDSQLDRPDLGNEAEEEREERQHFGRYSPSVYSSGVKAGHSRVFWNSCSPSGMDSNDSE